MKNKILTAFIGINDHLPAIFRVTFSSGTCRLVMPAIVLMLLILGCGRFLAARKSYFEGDRAVTAADALKKKVGHPFKAFTVEIEKDSFRAEVQAANDPNNFDEYKYVLGQVVGPTPIQNSKYPIAPAKFTFDFDAVDFSLIPKIVADALAKADLEGGEVSQLSFGRIGGGNVLYGKEFEPKWTIRINGMRAQTTAQADEHGNLLGVDMSKSPAARTYTVFNESELKKALDAVIEKFGNGPYFESVSLSNNRIEFDILTPENRNRSVQYVFDINGLHKNPLPPMPSRIMPGISEPFSMDDTHFTSGLSLIEKAKGASKLDTVGNVIIEKRRPMKEASEKIVLVWSISLKGNSGDVLVSIDPSGNVLNISHLH